MKMLFCDVCNSKIIIGEADEFNYTETADGPFCDVCWFFVQRIESLGDRIKDLKAEALKDRGEKQRQENIRNANRPSPYDASARRTGDRCVCGCGYKYTPGECRLR